MIGTVIAGQFVLRDVIGSGGMGKVFRADQKGVGRTVAVKIMHPHLIGDSTAAARFTTEARASSYLNHPHSIGVLDFGQTEVGVLYIVMEYLRGRPLDRVLREEHPMPFGRIAYMMCQVMEGVDAAHRLNIIHRDLKPENIFILERKTELDFVKVLDFGIAKMLDYEDRSVTTPGLVPGTPEYMSPEQARGEKLDPRSDVYSLGVIFYELLTGTVPFRGKSAVATMMSHVQDPPVLPSRRAPDRGIPAALEAIVMWALAKDPSDRISSAQHFRDVVSAWGRVAGVWPAHDPGASTPDVLLEFFSQDQLSEFADQVDEKAGPTSEKLESLPPPRIVEELVGRDKELRRLEPFLSSTAARTLRIQGPRGVGKSRLVQALTEHQLAASYRVLRCRPGDDWTQTPLRLAREAAAFCLGLELSDLNEASMVAAAGKVGLEEDDLPGLAELFCFSGPLEELDSGTRRRERAAAFRHLVYAAAAEPLLLIFEEIDRYDEPSRELISSLAIEPRGQLALVVTHAPDQSELWPEKIELLELGPLDEAGAADYLRASFGGKLTQELKAAAVRGTPLFIQQLAFALHYDGLTAPPDKVGDLLASRIDALGQSERRWLQTMAVLRSPVSQPELCVLTGAQVEGHSLDRLVERGLLSVRDDDGRRYAFSHDLLAIVVYSSIPAEVRREIHHAVAGALRADRRPDGTVAHHAYHADDGPAAIAELDRAGVSAARCIDYRSAIEHYTRALELVRREWGRARLSAEELDAVAVDLALRLAEVLRQTGDPLTAEGVLAEVLSVAAGQDVARARLRLDLGRLDLERGNSQRAQRHLQLARSDASAAKNPELQGEVLRELARVCGLVGQTELAHQLLAESLELTRRARGGRSCPAALLQAANICMQAGATGHALAYLREAATATDDDHGQLARMRVLMRLADIHQSCAEWTEAGQMLIAALDLANRVGDRSTLAALHIELGRVRRVAGDTQGAKQHLERAVRISRRIGWWEGIQRAQQESEMLRYPSSPRI